MSTPTQDSFSRYSVVIPGDKDTTLLYAKEHWLATARASIEVRGAFHVALSGGSTPKALFESFKRDELDWSKVHLYWSDERAVGPEHPDSNYKMALDAGLAQLGIPERQIHRMQAEEHIEQHAAEYELLLPPSGMDLVMLGMGDDGHTASLFPYTHALHSQERMIVENYVPSQETWRMTMTYDAINAARVVVVYVLGGAKAERLKEVLHGDEDLERLPVQGVGSTEHPALWVVDSAAGTLLGSQ